MDINQQLKEKDQMIHGLGSELEEINQKLKVLENEIIELKDVIKRQNEFNQTQVSRLKN